MVWKKACRIHSECHRSMPLWLPTQLHFCASSSPLTRRSSPLPGRDALPACPGPAWGARVVTGVPPPSPVSSTLSLGRPGAAAPAPAVRERGRLSSPPAAERSSSCVCLQAPAGSRGALLGVPHVSVPRQRGEAGPWGVGGTASSLARWPALGHLLLAFVAVRDPARESLLARLGFGAARAPGSPGCCPSASVARPRLSMPGLLGQGSRPLASVCLRPGTCITPRNVCLGP